MTKRLRGNELALAKKNSNGVYEGAVFSRKFFDTIKYKGNDIKDRLNYIFNDRKAMQGIFRRDDDKNYFYVEEDPKTISIEENVESIDITPFILYQSVGNGIIVDFFMLKRVCGGIKLNYGDGQEILVIHENVRKEVQLERLKWFCVSIIVFVSLYIIF